MNFGATAMKWDFADSRHYQITLAAKNDAPFQRNKNESSTLLDLRKVTDLVIFLPSSFSMFAD
jgi:hypothetical protein